jgi:hypothetical protein
LRSSDRIRDILTSVITEQAERLEQFDVNALPKAGLSWPNRSSSSVQADRLKQTSSSRPVQADQFKQIV